MIKFKISGIEGLKRKLNSLNGRNLFSIQFQLKLGYLVRDIIYRRTKSGYGVSSLTQSNAIKVPLAPLSASYILQRQGKLAFFKTKLGDTVPYNPKRKPKLGKYGSPKKSNLTFTGQMLDSIQVKLSFNGIDIYINDNTRSTENITNAQVAEYSQKPGTNRPARPFFNLTKDEFAILIRTIESEIRKITRRFS